MPEQTPACCRAAQTVVVVPSRWRDVQFCSCAVAGCAQVAETVGLVSSEQQPRRVPPATAPYSEDLREGSEAFEIAVHQVRPPMVGCRTDRGSTLATF